VEDAGLDEEELASPQATGKRKRTREAA